MTNTTSDFLIQRINEWGIRRIYGYPGDGINGIIGAINRAHDAVQYIQVRHEEMAAFMAWRTRNSQVKSDSVWQRRDRGRFICSMVYTMPNSIINRSWPLLDNKREPLLGATISRKWI